MEISQIRTRQRGKDRPFTLGSSWRPFPPPPPSLACAKAQPHGHLAMIGKYVATQHGLFWHSPCVTTSPHPFLVACLLRFYSASPTSASLRLALPFRVLLPWTLQSPHTSSWSNCEIRSTRFKPERTRRPNSRRSHMASRNIYQILLQHM